MTQEELIEQQQQSVESVESDETEPAEVTAMKGEMEEVEAEGVEAEGETERGGGSPTFVAPLATTASSGKKGPRRRQPPHYREIRSRVASITEKVLPILGDVALAKVGQLRVDELSSNINAVYGELVSLRRFLDKDAPEEVSLSNNNIITATATSSATAGPPPTSPFHTLQIQVVGQDEHSAKRQRTDTPPPKEGNANELSVLSDNDLHVPVVSSYRPLPHSARPSYEVSLNEKRREKLWVVMQSEIQNFAVGYNCTPLRTTEDFCVLAYTQDGRMKRTLKNDLVISEALFDGISGFRKRLYQADIGSDQDPGIRTYTNNLYNLKSKPQNYYHYLFAAAFWRWVRDEIDSKTVVSNGNSTEFAVNTVEDWWRECVSICNGFMKANPSRPEKKAFLKERLIADERRYGSESRASESVVESTNEPAMESVESNETSNQHVKELTNDPSE